MKRTILPLLLTLFIALGLQAENYPYRSDVLWVTVPDHADWLYHTGENPEIEIQFYKYGIPRDGVTVDYEIGADMMAAEKTGSLTLKDGRAKLKLGTMKTPGFRDLRLSAKVDGKTYKHHVKVGFDPEKLKPYTKLPKDFDAFWKANLDELAEVPLEFTIVPSELYTTDKIDAYLVKLRVNKAGQAVYGYLTVPKGANPGEHPVVLCPPGAGIKTIKEPLRHRYYAENGMVRFEIEIHGLNPEMPKAQFDEIAKAFGTGANNYLANGIDSKDNYYMKHVYQAMVRAIDFLTSRPEWDGRNVFVQGGSQGGALALVTAGLDPRVTAVVAHHPALSDMAGYLADRAGGYPHFKKEMLTPANVETLAYYDVVNFAPRITAPTLMTWGYNDNTCAPTTSYIVWNLITAPKEPWITPINEHWTSDATERAELDWLQSKVK